MSVVRLHSDPLMGGFYTAKDAARLLRIQNRRRIVSWLQGRSDGSFQPFVERDYKPIGKAQELSFWDLIEVRFIDYFRSQGLSLQYLRKVAAKAREELNHKHPFALDNVKFLTNRKKVFVRVASEDGEPRTREVLGDQFEMYDVIEGMLAKGVQFDPRTSIATTLQPLSDSCPNVIMHPRFAYGHPVVSDRHVPTAAIFRMFKAERGNERRVASAFGVDQEFVREAVRFEVELAA